MYEKYLLSGIMNDCYGCVEALIQDLKGYGFEVLSHDCESMKLSVGDNGDYVELELTLGGSDDSIIVEDFEEIYREEA